jgi:hypothetical protein
MLVTAEVQFQSQKEELIRSAPPGKLDSKAT